MGLRKKINKPEEVPEVEKPLGPPTREQLSQDRKQVEDELNKLLAEHNDSGNEILRLQTSIKESDNILAKDIGEMHKEHGDSGWSAFKDKLFKKSAPKTDQMHSSLRKMQAAQKYLKSEIIKKRREAEGLRKTLNELDEIHRVDLAARRAMRFFKRADELLKTYRGMQDATAACNSEELITKHLPNLKEYPPVLEVFFASHFKPSQAMQKPMYRAIAAGMLLTAFGKPLIRKIAAETNFPSGKGKGVYQYGMPTEYGIVTKGQPNK